MNDIALMVSLVTAIVSLIGGFATVFYKLGKFSHRVDTLEKTVKALTNDSSEQNDVIIKVQTSLDFICNSIMEMKTDIKEIRNDAIQREGR